MRYGYARVSTKHDQTLQSQLDILATKNCDRIFTDVISGSKDKRPGLDDMLDRLRPGDVIVCTELDRFDRGFIHSTITIDKLAEQGIWWESVAEPQFNTVDDDEGNGQLMRRVWAAFAAHFLRQLSRKTKAGLASARARGRIGGRPRCVLDDPKELAVAQTLYDSNTVPLADIAKRFGVTKQTVLRYCKHGGYRKGADSSTPTT